ncbi:MAG: CHAT domain-containing protein [Bacteroidia bacterium]|nr:CHAT domain-containing protein [Bacteroidia bacterium]
MFLLSGILLFVLFGGQMPNPESKDLSPAAAMLEQGVALFNDGKGAEAYGIFRTAQALALQEKDLELWASATRQVGIYLSSQLQFEAAIATLDSVIALTGQIDSMHKAIFFARRELGNIAVRKGDFPTGIARLSDLVADVERIVPDADSMQGMAYDALAQAHFYAGDLPTALANSQKARDLYLHWNNPESPALAHCENTLGIIYTYLGEYDEALSHYRTSLTLLEGLLRPDHPQIIQIRTNVGVLYGETGLFWESVETHRKNLPFLDQLPPLSQLNGLLNMGASLLVVEDYEEALRYFDQGEAFMKQYPELSAENAAYIASQRSVAYQHIGDPVRAKKLVQEALTLNKALFGANSPQLITEYIQLGDLMMEGGSLDSARMAFQEALTLSNTFNGTESLRSGFALQQLAAIDNKLGKWGAALENLGKARHIFATIDNLPGEAETLVEMAVTWRKAANLDSAMYLHQQAWETYLPDLPFSWNPPAEVLGNWTQIHLIQLLQEQGNTLLEQHSPENLSAALGCFEAAISLIDSQRTYYLAQQSRGNLIRSNLPLFESAIETANMLFQNTQEIRYLEKAWLLADRCKANNLRDHLRSVDAIHFGGIPDSLVQQERYFRQKLAYLESQYQSLEGDEKSAVAQQTFEFTEQYRKLLATLAEDYPDYYALRNQPQAPTLDLVWDKLLDEQAIYSYFWGEESLFVFRLAEEEIELFTVALTEAFTDQVDRWVLFISSPPKQGQEMNASLPASLTTILLPGLSADMEELIVIPDGPLGYLPFASLLVTDSEGSDYRNWPFLVKDHAFSYLNAAELWVGSRYHEKDRSGYAGFAPTFGSANGPADRSALEPLIHNREEVQEAAFLLEGEEFLDNQATEAALRSLDDEPMILHFATHALADEQNLMNSRLYFAAEGDSSDGVLYASEILGLSLHSPLAILSACQTGKGPLLRGEGVMSLARAFQYSGARRVMASLWQTDDEAAAALSATFFKQLKLGKRSAESLQLSHAEWLDQSPDFQAHPYYWAGMVLIGDGGEIPLEVNRGFPWWELFLGSMGLLVLMMWWWSRGATNKREPVVA